MEKFKLIIILYFVLSVSNILAQNIEECGLDENLKLTKAESEFLNNYLKEKRKDFNFIDKKIIIVSGNTGEKIGSKKQYFKDIKSWQDNGNQIATTLILLDEEEKRVSGCDGILTLWVKRFTERDKEKIINKIIP